MPARRAAHAVAYAAMPHKNASSSLQTKRAAASASMFPHQPIPRGLRCKQQAGFLAHGSHTSPPSRSHSGGSDPGMHATDYSDEIAQTSICFPFLKSIALDTGRLYSLYDNAEMAFFQAVIAQRWCPRIVS